MSVQKRKISTQTEFFASLGSTSFKFNSSLLLEYDHKLHSKVFEGKLHLKKLDPLNHLSKSYGCH